MSQTVWVPSKTDPGPHGMGNGNYPIADENGEYPAFATRVEALAFAESRLTPADRYHRFYVDAYDEEIEDDA